MKKRTSGLIIALLLVLLPLVAWGATWYVDAGGGWDFTTIQAAIDAANPGDTIIVAPGVYVEDLVIGNTKNNLELVGNGAVIKGVDRVASAAWPLADPNIEILADGVKLHGFIIESPDPLLDNYSSGIVIGAKDVEIYDNEFRVASAANWADISQALQTYRDSVDISGLAVYENTFTHLGTESEGYEAIFINHTLTGNGLVTIRDNRFSGKVLRAITTERSNMLISDNTIETSLEPAHTLCAINVKDYDGREQSDVEICRNTITGNSGFDIGIDMGLPGCSNQDLHDILVYGNSIDKCLTGIRLRCNLIGTGVVFRANRIYGNTLGMDAVNATGLIPVDAELNFWGADGIDPDRGKPGVGSNNPVSIRVDYDPWLYYGNGAFGKVYYEDGLADTDVFGPYDLSASPGPIITVTLNGVGGTGTMFAFMYTDPVQDLVEAAPFDRFAADTGAQPVYFFDIAAFGFTPGLGRIELKTEYTNADIAGFLEADLLIYYWDNAAGHWVSGDNIVKDAATNTIWCDIGIDALMGTPIALAAPGVAPPTGAAETDVTDETPRPQVAKPGQTDVVLQEVLFQENLVASDSNPTDISTITIYAVGPLAVLNRLDKLSLAVDTNDNGVYDAGDTIIAYRTLPFNNPGLPPLNVTFGVPGRLLLQIPDTENRRVFVVADIAITALNGEDILTGVEATAEDDLSAQGSVSSDFNPATTVFPIWSTHCTVVAFTTGDAETNLIDATQVRAIADGENRVIVQEFVISDPNTGTDITPDGHPTWINSLVVRRTADSSIVEDDITRMWIVVESDGIPGLSFWDEVVAGPVAVAGQDIDMVNDGLMFDDPCPGANPFLDMDPTTTPFIEPVWDQQQVRLYVLADFEGTLQDGDWLKLKTTVYASDGYGPVMGVSSDFEDPTLMASNPVVVGGATATVTVGDVTLAGTTGFVNISVDALGTPGLGEMQVGQTGSFTYDPAVIYVVDVVGVAPYVVLSDTAPQTSSGVLKFCVAYDPSLGQPITSGPIARIEVEGAPGVNVGDACALNITQVDVLRDVNGFDIPVLAIIPGTATIAVAQGQKGDVNDDGTVDITDARLVAEYAIGQTPAGTFIEARADVAPPPGIDITDARWIAEAALGIRRLAFMAAKVGPKAEGVAATAQVAINEDGQLVISGSTAELADIQGTLYYNPSEVTINDVVGLNGFQVLASSIDNAAGAVCFAAAKLSGAMVIGGPIIKFVGSGDLSTAVINIDVLRDVHARDVPYEVPMAVDDLEFGNTPNPITDVHTTTFEVKGLMAALVEAIRVQIFDLSGRLVYEREEVGASLNWHTENDYGELLANGVYLYKLYALINGEWVVSETKKLAILR